MSARWRIVALTLTALLVTTFASGCWDRHETNDTAFILAAGLSRVSNGDFRLIAEIAEPRKMGKSGGSGGGGSGGGGGDGNAGMLRETTGKTVYKAFARLAGVVGRVVDDGHCNILLVQEDIIKDGSFAEVLDWMSRFYQIRHRKVVLVCQDDPARLLAASAELDPTQGLNIYKTLETAKEDCLPGFESTLMDIMSRQSTLGLHVILGRIALETQTDGSKATVFDGIDVLDADKLVGVIPKDESRFVNLLLNETRGASLILEIPSPPGVDDISTPTPGYHAGTDPEAEAAPTTPGPTVVHVTSADTNIRAELQNGKPVVNVSIKLKGQVVETGAPLDFSSPSVMRSLETVMSQYVTDKVRAVIALTQSFPKGCDIFFFGESIHERYPAVWHSISQQWDEYYKTLQVNVTVSGSVTNTGRALNPSVPHR